MLVIRLSRVGKKKHPSYRILVQEKHKDPWGKAFENVGTYDPRTKPKTIKLNEERIKAWLAKGAEPSPTVHNLLVEAKILTGAKRKNTVGHKDEKKEETNAAA
jgi:small subunit ribosomal protein S16